MKSEACLVGRRPSILPVRYVGDSETVRGATIRLGHPADGTDNMQNGPAHCAALEGRRDIVQLEESTPTSTP